MFKIHNIRYGFATNSSSSHSMIFSGKRKLESDNPCQEAIRIADGSIGKYENDLDFGDGFFTLGAKLLYGLVSLISRDFGSIPEDRDWNEDEDEEEEDAKVEDDSLDGKDYFYIGDSEVKVRKNDEVDILVKKYSHLFPEFTREVYELARKINLPSEGWNDYEEISDQLGWKETPEEFISRLRDPMTYVMYVSDSSG